MLLNDAQALNEGGGQLLDASFDAFALGEAIIDVCTHTDDCIELRSAGNVTEVHMAVTPKALEVSRIGKKAKIYSYKDVEIRNAYHR